MLAQLQQAGQVVDVGVEEGHRGQDLGARGQLRLLLGLAPGHHAEVEEALGDLAEHPGGEGGVGVQALGQFAGPFTEGLRPPGRRRGPGSSSGRTLLSTMAPRCRSRRDELAGEELGLAQRRGLEGGDHHEGGAPVAEQPGHRFGPLDEAGVHRLEEDEELGDVGQELGAEDPVGHLVEGPGGEVHQLGAVGDDQPAQQARAEEVGHALGGVEEVEGVAGRRGVHHDQVVVALGVDLVEALHGDVVVALDEAPRDVAVQGVGQDLLPGVGVGGVAPDQGVPALLGVEHGRPQLAAGRDPGLLEDLPGRSAARCCRSPAARGRRPAAGRVDGEDEDPPPVVAGGHGRRRRRRGRLAHSPGPAGHDDLLGGQQAVERSPARGPGGPGGPGRGRVGAAAGAGPLGRGHQNPSSSPSDAATCRVVRRPWNRVNR